MLPQKIGLDVAIEKSSGKQCTIEINGQHSGHQGLVDLQPGRNVRRELLDRFGRPLTGSRILVHPEFPEFYVSKDTWQDVEAFRKAYGIEVVYAAPNPRPIPYEMYRHGSGQDFGDFRGIFGMTHVADSGFDDRMINAPALEAITCNKMLQYVLLKDIEGLNMPHTVLMYRLFDSKEMERLAVACGKIVTKPINGSQGQNVNVRGKSRTEKKVARSAFRLMRADMRRDLAKLGYDGSKFDTPSARRFILARYQEKPAETVAFLKDQLTRIWGTCVQPFIETQPVRSDKTGEDFFACARLLWCDGYVGGYWRLSAWPISAGLSENAVVNYHTSHNGQLFKPEEDAAFRAYAERIVPQILAKAQSYENRPAAYGKAEEQVFIDAVKSWGRRVHRDSYQAFVMASAQE